MGGGVYGSRSLLAEYDCGVWHESSSHIHPLHITYMWWFVGGADGKATHTHTRTYGASFWRWAKVCPQLHTRTPFIIGALDGKLGYKCVATCVMFVHRKPITIYDHIHCVYDMFRCAWPVMLIRRTMKSYIYKCRFVTQNWCSRVRCVCTDAAWVLVREEKIVSCLWKTFQCGVMRCVEKLSMIKSWCLNWLWYIWIWIEGLYICCGWLNWNV